MIEWIDVTDFSATERQYLNPFTGKRCSGPFVLVKDDEVACVVDLVGVLPWDIPFPPIPPTPPTPPKGFENLPRLE